MSFVTTVRDYVDFINQNYDSMSSHGNLLEHLPFIFSHTLLYIFESIKYGLFYLLTFRWLTDLLYLPSWAPDLSKALLKETFYPLENPLVNSFTLLEAPSLLHNKFLVGFLNSFFVSLPISAVHLLAARRLFVEGIPAGVAAGMGTIVGQSCFLASILFGWRWVLIPWLSFEPLNYLVGILVLFQTIYTICHRPSIKIVSPRERSTLLTFFFLNLVLTWCEQSSLFQYIGNLTLTSDPSYVEPFFASNRLSSLGTHAFYLIGFVLGSCCFSLLFALMGLKLKEWWLRWSTMTTSRLVNRLNFFFLVGVTALSLASIPYYGIDYLFTNGLGFIPGDKTLQGTSFSPAAGMADPNHYLGVNSRYQSLDTDVTPFDGGQYMAPPFPKSFEDLNYQGEHYWTAKMDRKIMSASTGGQKGKQFVTKWSSLFGEAIKKEVPFDETMLSTQKSRALGRNGGKESPSISAVQKSKHESFMEEEEPVYWYKEFEEQSIDPSLTPSSSDDEQMPASFDDEDWDQYEVTDSMLASQKAAFDAFGRLSELPPLKLASEKEAPDELKRLIELSPLETEEDLQNKEEELKQKEKLFTHFFTLIRPGFSPFFRTDIPEPTNLEKFLKNKFYENPLYHLLLRVDIDTFLARQPSSHSMSPEEEVDLFRRRQLLADYYDSLQDYLELQEGERLSEIDIGVGSYADQVYNHQFKGTLKVVRRLFSITLDPEKNRNEERVLKFDQPLFHSVEAEQHPLVHEEEDEFARSETNQSSLLELTNPRPFYAGWDEQLRRLVITTRYLPRNFSTHGMRSPDTEISRRFFKEYFPLAQRLDLPSNERKDATTIVDGDAKGRNSFFNSTKKILFTAWPLPTERAESASISSKTFASTDEGKALERLNLFIHPFGEYHDWEMEWWPENLGAPMPDRQIIPPNRGGFVWPGSSEFPFDLKKLIPNIKRFFR